MIHTIKKLRAEITAVRARLADLEAAERVLIELDGGAAAEQKVRALGKQMGVAVQNTRITRRSRKEWEAELLAHLSKYPRSTTSELATAMGLANTTTAKKQCEQLYVEHKVIRERDGRDLRWSLAIPAAETALPPKTKTGNGEYTPSRWEPDVVKFMILHPNVRMRELAEGTSTPITATAKRIKRLLKLKRVTRTGKGTGMRYNVAPKVVSEFMQQGRA